MELFNVDSFKRQNGRVVGVAFQQHKAQQPFRIYQEAWVIYNAQEAGMNYKYIVTYRDSKGNDHSFKLRAEKEEELCYIVEPEDSVEKEIFNRIPEYVKKPTDLI